MTEQDVIDFTNQFRSVKRVSVTTLAAGNVHITLHFKWWARVTFWVYRGVWTRMNTWAHAQRALGTKISLAYRYS